MDDVARKDAWLLEYVPDWFRTQEMCIRAVNEDRDSLIHVPGWFVVAQEMIDYSHVASPRGYDDRAFKSYQGYKKREAQ